jgi:hypothetical protein
MTGEQRGEKTATYFIGDTLWLILMLKLKLMITLEWMVLKIHRGVGVAVRQAEVEGYHVVQVGVDGDHKLSLIITNDSTNATSQHHCTSISSNPLSALHFPSTHSRSFTINTKKTTN